MKAETPFSLYTSATRHPEQGFQWVNRLRRYGAIFFRTTFFRENIFLLFRSRARMTTSTLLFHIWSTTSQPGEISYGIP